MLFRKVLTAFYTSLLAIVSLTIFEYISGNALEGELFSVILGYTIFVVPIVFVYGIISSLIADGISKKVKKHRNSISFGFHIFFGVGFILPYSLFFEYQPFSELNVVNVMTHPVTFFGALFSILFFIIDFFIRKKDSRLESIRV